MKNKTRIIRKYWSPVSFISIGIISERFRHRPDNSNCPDYRINGGQIPPTARLLRGALHALSTGGNVIIILVHATRSTVGTSLGRLAAINVLQLKVLNHGIGGRLSLLHTGRQDLLQQLQVLHLILLRELDLELDVQVAVVVVAERGHTLAGDNLDGI